ncbi:MAG: Wzz/FepE/Etk N-terminal domain-containing protein, partial [Anaerolineae bacterium]
MEEEIDLRHYVLVLLKYWKWIIGATAVAAVVALVVSFILPPTYEATALVAVTKPRYVMQFDPRIETLNNIQPAYKAYPELASSDEALQELLTRLNPRPERVETLEDLKRLVKAKAGTDPSLILLTVRLKDPEEAARIANLWAEIFVRRANEIYGTESQSQLQFYQQQLQRAEAELRAAEEALVAFQAQNQESILEHQLGSRQQMHADYLADQRQIAYIIQDIRGLREQLSRQPGEQPVTLADQLTTLFLQIKAFNAQASAPIQLQVDSAASLSEKSLAEQ